MILFFWNWVHHSKIVPAKKGNVINIQSNSATVVENLVNKPKIANPDNMKINPKIIFLKPILFLVNLNKRNPIIGYVQSAINMVKNSFIFSILHYRQRVAKPNSSSYLSITFFFNFFIINTLPIFNRLLVKPISFFFIVNESSVVWWGKYRN